MAKAPGELERKATDGSPARFYRTDLIVHGSGAAVGTILNPVGVCGWREVSNTVRLSSYFIYLSHMNFVVYCD